MQTEHTIHEVPGAISITNFRVGNERASYPLHTISRVSLAEKKHPTRNAALAVMIFFALASLSNLSNCFTIGETRCFVALACTGAITALCVWWLTRLKPLHEVVVISSGSRAVLVSTPHEDLARRAAYAVEQTLGWKP